MEKALPVSSEAGPELLPAILAPYKILRLAIAKDKSIGVFENLVFFTENIAVTDKENKIVCNFGGSVMIMNKSIPKQIQLIMSREGLNYCETFDYEGKTYYILSYVSENGEPQPTGLPIIYYIDKENPVQLSFDKSLLILSKLPDDGEE